MTKQVCNLGAGLDTRAFWLDSLKSGVTQYMEVDQQSVYDLREKIITEQGMQPFCKRNPISMNFEKESTKDLPNHGFDNTIATCWILEGLIMYLKEPAMVQMFEELDALSVLGSKLIVNYLTPGEEAPSQHMGSPYVQGLLQRLGWSCREVARFGDSKLNFGRYPVGVEPSK